jgi:hypothetical protein
MNMHPSVGVNPPGPTTADPFASEAIYELKIDTDGDTVADIAYRVRFTSADGGAQTEGRRPRRCAALRGWRLPGRATVARSSSTGRRSQQGTIHG